MMSPLLRKSADGEFRRMSEPEPSPGKRLQSASSRPPALYVGGQSVQARLAPAALADDPTSKSAFLPRRSAASARLRLGGNFPACAQFCAAHHFWHLWRGSRGGRAHIFSAPIGHSCSLRTRMVELRSGAAQSLINYPQRRGSDHLRRFPPPSSASRFDKIVVPLRYLRRLREFDLPSTAVEISWTLSVPYSRALPLRPQSVAPAALPVYSVDVVVRAFCASNKEYRMPV